MARKRRTEAARTTDRAREIPAGEFKAKCLALMDRVRERQEEYVITKHGKPVAKVIPIETESASLIGALKGKLRIKGDILATGLRWDAES